MPPAKAAPHKPASPHRRWLIVLGLLVLVTYANSLGAGLPFDNAALIRDDPRVQAATWDNLSRILTTNYWWPRNTSEYRPFTLFTYLFQYSVLGSGAEAWGYHAVNLLLHGLNAGLLYFLLFALWEAPVTAFCGAALFAVHPIGTESVTNVVGRADLLAAAAVLGGLLLYIRRPRGWVWMLAAVTTLGVLSKEVVTVLPALLLLYDLVRRRWQWQGYVAAAAPVAAFWAARAAVLARMRTPEIPFLDNPLIGADFLTARLTALRVFGKYLWLLVWPLHLSSDYSYNQIPVAWHWAVLAGLAALLLMLAAAAVAYRRRGDIFFLIGFFLIALAPVSNFIILIGTIMGERLLYLPLAAFAGLAAAAIFARGATRAAWGLTIVLLAAGAARSMARNLDWASELQLYGTDVAVCPESYKLHMNLAAALSQQPGPARQIDRELAEAEAAVTLIKNVPPLRSSNRAYEYLGVCYTTKGDTLGGPAGQPWYEKAAAAYQTAARISDLRIANMRELDSRRGWRPEQLGASADPAVYLGLGTAYMRLGRYSEAEQALTRARLADPGAFDTYPAAARLYLSTGRGEEGLVALYKALILRPGEADVEAMLRQVYRTVDPQGCGVVANLNASPSPCVIVQHYRCAAYAGLARDFEQVQAASRAQQVRTAAATGGCQLPR